MMAHRLPGIAEARRAGASWWVAACLVVLSLAPAWGQSSQTTLRFVGQSDIRILDPIWTTDYNTRNHGYLIFDTLFALDANFKPQPQMVDSWSLSPDQLSYRFTLRPGLTFHDGQPVRAIDCIASLQRWSKRDSFGQTMAQAVESMEAIDDRSFTILLKRPFPLLIDGLAKISSNVPFIMPERLAKTDAFTQVTEMVGSGPFKFVPEERQPGHKLVYVRNPDYVARAEPANWASGGKVAKVDRVEWLYLPDAATAAAALQAGEVDWWQEPPLDLLPVLARSPDVAVERLNPLGNLGLIRFNHLQPPFDNPKLRRAVLAATSQKDFMGAAAGDAKNWRECFSFFTCGTPMAGEAGAEIAKAAPDLALAKRLLQEAGYKGERVVVLDPTDISYMHAQSLVAADLFARIGLTVDLQASDWGTVLTRRTSKEPVEKGGWSVFPTTLAGPEAASPAYNFALRGTGEAGFFGWSTDAKLEALRSEWLQATAPADQKRIAAEIQQQAFETMPYLPTGQLFIATAFRKTVKGIVPAPIILLWNVEKS